MSFYNYYSVATARYNEEQLALAAERARILAERTPQRTSRVPHFLRAVLRLFVQRDIVVIEAGPQARRSHHLVSR